MLKKKAVMAVVALAMSMVTPSFAQGNAGCTNGMFVGSYTSAVTNTDVWGDGTGVTHTVISQLNLHGDGTAYQERTGFPDLMLSTGSATPLVGSWACRQDGKLVVTFLLAFFGATADASIHSINPAPPVDLLLLGHIRVTYLFSVTDNNTLTSIEFRRRSYTAAADPTNPTGGTLGPLNTSPVVYKRLVASDADLLLP